MGQAGRLHGTGRGTHSSPSMRRTPDLVENSTIGQGTCAHNSRGRPVQKTGSGPYPIAGDGLYDGQDGEMYIEPDTRPYMRVLPPWPQLVGLLRQIEVNDERR